MSKHSFVRVFWGVLHVRMEYLLLTGLFWEFDEDFGEGKKKEKKL